ncbi:hypothetical protein ACN47E_006621 [Coniothyrium glycines]
MSHGRRASSRSRISPAAGLSMPLAGRLEQRIVTRTIHDWVRTEDLSARLVHFDESTLAGLEPSSPTPAAEYPQSLKSLSSMAPTTLVQLSTASAYPPSLRSFDADTEATPTETSISTGLASHLPHVPLLEEIDGVLEVPHVQLLLPIFECAFWFLNCNQIFNEQEEWETHCLAHFQGEEPPQHAQCPLCDWSTSRESGLASWHERMHHLAAQHAMYGQTLRTSRPDFALFQHLWHKKLIDTHDLKELKGGNHNLTRLPANFVETARRDDRRHRGGRPHRTQHVATTVRQVGLRTR